ncbi:energy transducer TonB [Pseudoalteromonas shioyasakiensis]|uniref:energy transducer TonB n=1 Tax=Pseudoalteromonas shioyasakiensis TaxID=1190813 RepID=UPI0021186A28|nr:energy transducer TonB [Pseudoalteromonas shioyasakiensis]MCQ8879742.1 energy transducer TonB [Pseudoalteromonas shioyasakiensis]
MNKVSLNIIILTGFLFGCESTSYDSAQTCQPLTYDCHKQLKEQKLGAKATQTLFKYVESGFENLHILKELDGLDGYDQAIIDQTIAQNLVHKFDYEHALAYIEKAINSNELNANEYKRALLLELNVLLQLKNYDVFKEKVSSYLAYTNQSNNELLAMVNVYSERSKNYLTDLLNDYKGDDISTSEVENLTAQYLNPKQAASSNIKPIRKVIIEPRYPSSAARHGLDGWVVAQYDINHIGEPINIKVLESSPEGYFEEVGINAISTWRYRVSFDENGDVKNGENFKVLIDWALNRKDQVKIKEL